MSKSSTLDATTLDAVVAELAAHISGRPERPFVLGVSGGQGAGKSTLCSELQQTLPTRAGLTAVTLGLDDFYLPRAARDLLAASVSPLCRIRGVPGTHDIALLRATFDRLLTADETTATALPRFSKSHDDQLSEAEWARFVGRPDIIIVEGWCVGGRAAHLNSLPQTDWEQAHDPDGIWKNWSRRSAAEYEAVWDQCHAFALLQHPDFDAVIDSRWQQEQDNAAASGVWQFASRDEVAAFCAHYESWTKAVWTHLPTQVAFHLQREGCAYLRLS